MTPAYCGHCRIEKLTIMDITQNKGAEYLVPVFPQKLLVAHWDCINVAGHQGTGKVVSWRTIVGPAGAGLEEVLG